MWRPDIMARLLRVGRRLGCCDFSCPVVIVAGTNGKGTTVNYLQAVYQQAGKRTGLFTSPHVHCFTERIQIDGAPVLEQDLIPVFSLIESHCGDESLSFFEYSTLAALVLFQRAQLDLVILEVGLGGRLDATNIVDADVAVVTSIQLDHTQYLGSTRAAIAYEKLGVLRSGCPFVCGEAEPPPVVSELVQYKGVPYSQIGRDYHYTVEGESWCFSHDGESVDQLPLPHLRLDHAATALQVVSSLSSRLPIDLRLAAVTMAGVRLPGRFSVYTDPCLTVLDVAHNPASTQYLMAELARRYPQRRWIAVCGMLEDKMIGPSLAPCIPYIEKWCCASLTGPRAAASDILSGALRDLGENNCYTFPCVDEAMQSAYDFARTDPQLGVVIFGSFHTVSAAQRFFASKGSVVHGSSC